MSTQAGKLITDGTAIFIIDDIRDGSRVGDIILRPTLRQGYIKANGAVLTASEYPRLVNYVVDNELSVTEGEWSAGKQGMYVYDADADTLRVPNVVDRVLQAADTAGNNLGAGLPNITGYFGVFDDQCYEAAGAFYYAAYINYDSTSTLNGGGHRTGFNASRSSAIYGNSTTVSAACHHDDSTNQILRSW